MAFRSGLEEIVADLFVDLGIEYEYECTKLDYTVSHKYCPDFKLPNGIFIEVKGYWDSQDRRKIRNIIKQHPDLDLRMVFQDPNKTISKKSKTTYGQYCTKLGIRWAKYTKIPIDWLK